MSDKQTVMEALAHMPDTATLDEISEEIATLAAIRKGVEAADEGRVMSHADVQALLTTWI